MTPETLKALKGSIEKWRKIVEERGVDGGWKDCPLCLLFHPEIAFDDGRERCEGCPVRQSTRQSYCKGTPHKAFVQVCDEDFRATTPKAKAAARAELEFLRSLLPEEEGE